MRGVSAGVLTTTVIGLVFVWLHSGEQIPPLRVSNVEPILHWIDQNFGMSVGVFAVVLILYLGSLWRLRYALDADRSLEEVAQAEQLVDVWTSLFFGVGVIWTAIGMRSALIHALGDPTGIGGADASAVLERMVEGGILLALSTTIFGGIGGYLMRVVKVMTLGSVLKRYYHRAARSESRDIEATLHAIREQLECLVNNSNVIGDANHVQPPMGDRRGTPA